jgi:MFS transporter, putative metabolite:H+ symporter
MALEIGYKIINKTMQTETIQNEKVSKAAILVVIVAALGFFVDIYDMMIFSAIKEKSYEALHILKADYTNNSKLILNYQMGGMLFGGFLWGTIGDKFGRLKVLFGSILMYSVFNFLNAFVGNIEQYKWCRFFAGIGLAGELGAGITLVTELMPKKYRGFAVALVGSIGMLGAVTAGLVANANISWQTAYIIGAVLGIVLLIMRIGVVESGLFDTMKNSAFSRGSFVTIVKDKKLLWKFICVLLVGIPGWYATGILITHTSKIAESMGMDVNNLPKSSIALSLNFMGFACGDILCGLLSQYLKSRKKAILVFLGMYAFFVTCYFLFGKNSVTIYYALFVGMGISVAYSIMLFTLAAEQFGTNIRTLATSTSLNLVRAWVIPLGYFFTLFAAQFNNNFALSAMILGGISITIAFLALTQLEETYIKDLDYYEV